MRKLIVSLLAAGGSLYLTSYLITGFSITPDLSSYFSAALIFLILNFLLLPLVKLLLLPVNLLTLGLFRWVANLLVIYIFDLITPQITIVSYRTAPISNQLISLQPVDLSYFWTLVLSALSLAFFYSLISSLFKAE